jgi:hypothetical protein
MEMASAFGCRSQQGTMHAATRDCAVSPSMYHRILGSTARSGCRDPIQYSGRKHHHGHVITGYAEGCSSNPGESSESGWCDNRNFRPRETLTSAGLNFVPRWRLKNANANNCAVVPHAALLQLAAQFFTNATMTSMGRRRISTTKYENNIRYRNSTPSSGRKKKFQGNPSRILLQEKNWPRLTSRVACMRCGHRVQE